MSLVTLNEVLPQARTEGRAVGAFNIANYETGKAVIMAAEVENQPVIMQVYQRLMEDPFIPALTSMMRKLAENASVPVVVHLDHGASLDQVKLAIDCGFSSVMFDGSQLPFEDNLAQTRQAAEYAHKHGVSIEGELGYVPLNGTEAAENIPLSTPEEAKQFAEATGIDALAVSIGTAHGYYTKEPQIDVDLSRHISEAVSIPLVLHGGSGTPHDIVRQVLRNGFAKVNISTEFQHKFQAVLKDKLDVLGKKFLPVDKIMINPTQVSSDALRPLIEMFTNP